MSDRAVQQGCACAVYSASTITCNKNYTSSLITRVVLSCGTYSQYILGKTCIHTVSK